MMLEGNYNEGDKNENNKLKILHFKATSTCNKVIEIQSILSQSFYDLICISKTWINKSFLDHAITAGLPYSVFRCD